MLNPITDYKPFKTRQTLSRRNERLIWPDGAWSICKKCPMRKIFEMEDEPLSVDFSTYFKEQKNLNFDAPEYGNRHDREKEHGGDTYEFSESR